MDPPSEGVEKGKERGRSRTIFGKMKDSLKNTKLVRLLQKSPTGRRTSMRKEHVVSTPLSLPYPHSHQDKSDSKTTILFKIFPIVDYRTKTSYFACKTVTTLP